MSRPAGANPLTDFYNSYQLLYSLPTRIIFEVIRFTDYGVIHAELIPSQSFTHNFSVHPVGKTMIKKLDTYQNGSFTMQSLVEIVRRALAVDVEIWCMYYVCNLPALFLLR